MLGEIDFTVMTEDELMAFWKRYHRASRRDAAELCGERFPGYTTVAASAANYACNLAVAMSCRRRDDERAARVYDHAAQLALEEIPAELQHARQKGTNLDGADLSGAEQLQPKSKL